MRRSLVALTLALLSFAGAAQAQTPAAFVRAGQRDVATLAHQAPTPTRDAQIAARIDASHDLSPSEASSRRRTATRG